jgi:hypothetical protein
VIQTAKKIASIFLQFQATWSSCGVQEIVIDTWNIPIVRNEIYSVLTE